MTLNSNIWIPTGSSVIVGLKKTHSCVFLLEFAICYVYLSWETIFRDDFTSCCLAKNKVENRQGYFIQVQEYFSVYFVYYLINFWFNRATGLIKYLLNAYYVFSTSPAN